MSNRRRKTRKRKRTEKRQHNRHIGTSDWDYRESYRSSFSRSRREDVPFDDETMEVLEFLYNIMEFFDNGITCY